MSWSRFQGTRQESVNADISPIAILDYSLMSRLPNLSSVFSCNSEKIVEPGDMAVHVLFYLYLQISWGGGGGGWITGKVFLEIMHGSDT